MNTKYFLIIFLTVGNILTIKSMQQQPAANQPMDDFLLKTQINIPQAILQEISDRLTAITNHQPQLQQQYQAHQSDDIESDSEVNDYSDNE